MDPESPAGPASGNRAQDLPLFPLRTVLVPQMPLSLHVFEPRYRRLVADLLDEYSPAVPIFGVVNLRHGFEVGELSDVHDIGTTARITDVSAHPDGSSDLSTVGERRFRIHALDTVTKPYLVARVHYLEEVDGDVSEYDFAAVLRTWHSHVAVLARLTGAIEPPPIPPVDQRELSYAVAQLTSLPLEDRQALLSCADTAARLAAARRILRRETVLLKALRAVPTDASTFRSGLFSD